MVFTSHVVVAHMSVHTTHFLSPSLQLLELEFAFSYTKNTLHSGVFYSRHCSVNWFTTGMLSVGQYQIVKPCSQGLFSSFLAFSLVFRMYYFLYTFLNTHFSVVADIFIHEECHHIYVLQCSGYSLRALPFPWG